MDAREGRRDSGSGVASGGRVGRTEETRDVRLDGTGDEVDVRGSRRNPFGVERRGTRGGHTILTTPRTGRERDSHPLHKCSKALRTGSSSSPCVGSGDVHDARLCPPRVQSSEACRWLGPSALPTGTWGTESKVHVFSDSIGYLRVPGKIQGGHRCPTTHNKFSSRGDTFPVGGGRAKALEATHLWSKGGGWEVPKELKVYRGSGTRKGVPPCVRDVILLR